MIALHLLSFNLILTTALPAGYYYLHFVHRETCWRLPSYWDLILKQVCVLLSPEVLCVEMSPLLFLVLLGNIWPYQGLSE